MHPALKYAEDELAVHKVWERVQLDLEELDTLFAELDKAQDRKRELNDLYADREVELIGEMRTVHHSMSDTRFKSEYKTWERTDKELTELRIELNHTHSLIQGLEYDADHLKLRIKAGSSRLEELGGYLRYLAAVKTQAEKPTTPKESSEE